MELVHDAQLGKVGTLDLKLEKSKLVLTVAVGVPVAGVDANVGVSVDATVILDLIAKAIPGAVDDAVIAIMKSAIAAL